MIDANLEQDPLLVAPMKFIVSQMPWPIMFCDDNHVIFFANSALKELFNRPLQGIIGHCDDEYLKITDEKLEISEFAIMHHLELPDKKSLSVARYQTPIILADRGMILINVIMDMSLAVGMQREQMRSAELLGIFQTIATVNHQINNPLFGLMATLQLLTEEMKDSDPAIVKKLARMTECSERIKQITEDLSQVVRPARRVYAANEDMLDLMRASEHCIVEEDGIPTTE